MRIFVNNFLLFIFRKALTVQLHEFGFFFGNLSINQDKFMQTFLAGIGGSDIAGNFFHIIGKPNLMLHHVFSLPRALKKKRCDLAMGFTDHWAMKGNGGILDTT
jgi:hypothetical protein